MEFAAKKTLYTPLFSDMPLKSNCYRLSVIYWREANVDEGDEFVEEATVMEQRQGVFSY